MSTKLTETPLTDALPVPYVISKKEANGSYSASVAKHYYDNVLKSHRTIEAALSAARQRIEASDKAMWDATGKLASLADVVASALRNTQMFGVAEKMSSDPDLREYIWMLSYEANKQRSRATAALSAAEQRAEAMKRALMDLRHTQHYECEDPWYSCPLSPDGCANEQQVGCTCGTEAHNNRIDAAIASGAGESNG